VQTSAAYVPASCSLNMLHRITRPQHTGTQTAEVVSGAMNLLTRLRASRIIQRKSVRLYLHLVDFDSETPGGGESREPRLFLNRRRYFMAV
jgi:hypothetical protein